MNIDGKKSLEKKDVKIQMLAGNWLNIRVPMHEKSCSVIEWMTLGFSSIQCNMKKDRCIVGHIKGQICACMGNIQNKYSALLTNLPIFCYNSKLLCTWTYVFLVLTTLHNNTSK